MEKFIIHEPVDHFFISTHAFHNAHLVRAALPRSLTKPIPIYNDRPSLHQRLASELRYTHENKAAEAAKGGGTKKRKRKPKDNAGPSAKRTRTKRGAVSIRPPAPRLVIRLDPARVREAMGTTSDGEGDDSLEIDDDSDDDDDYSDDDWSGEE